MPFLLRPPHSFYPRDTHIVENGRDGTILVRRASDHRIDNSAGHALLRMDGSGIVARNGSLIADGAAAAVPAAAAPGR